MSIKLAWSFQTESIIEQWVMEGIHLPQGVATMRCNFLGFLLIMFIIRGPLRFSASVDISITITTIKAFMKASPILLLFISFPPSLFLCPTSVFTMEMLDTNKNSICEDYVHSNLLFQEKKRQNLFLYRGTFPYRDEISRTLPFRFR